MVAFNSFLFFNLIYTFFFVFPLELHSYFPSVASPNHPIFHLLFIRTSLSLFSLSPLPPSHSFLPFPPSLRIFVASPSFLTPLPPLIKGDVKQYKTPSTASINTDAKMPLMRLKIHKGQEFLVIWTRSNKHSFPFTFPRSGRFPRALSPSSFLRLPFKGGFSFGRL